MEIEVYGSRVAPSSSSSSSSDPHGFRCYSTSYVPNEPPPKEMKFKKGKSTSGSSSSKSGWILSDPEIQRKKRVAGYKAFALEGKMKGSFRKSFRWIKDRCSQVVHGRW